MNSPVPREPQATAARSQPMTVPAAGNSPANGSRKVLVLPLVLTGVFLAFSFIPRVHGNPRLAWTFYGVAAVLLFWQLALFFSSKRNGTGFHWEFHAVKSHYIQATVHFSIYT